MIGIGGKQFLRLTGMYYQKLKKSLSITRKTPFHPQWFAYLHETSFFRSIGEQAQGVILDIGCADQYIKHHIPLNQDYIGLDYYQTATQWYKTKPHIFADAQSLPFADNSIDTVLFLDVMEHLPFPDRALKEIHRVLKPQGQCIIQVPILYPVYDAPLDFQRWTCYGLKILINKQGLTLKKLNAQRQTSGNSRHAAEYCPNQKCDQLGWTKTSGFATGFIATHSYSVK